MRRMVVFVAAVAALSAAALTPAHAEGGCNRIGETGYHYYNFCLGPWFLYAQRGPEAKEVMHSRRVGEAHRRRHHHPVT